jgi:hypothetical protein
MGPEDRGTWGAWALDCCSRVAKRSNEAWFSGELLILTRSVAFCSPSRRIRAVLWRWRAANGMADTATIDPIILARFLCVFLDRTIPGLIARAIERIAMRRVPHPVARGSRGRTQTKERLSRRRRRGRGHCNAGLARLRLRSYSRRRLDAADLIKSIME